MLPPPALPWAPISSFHYYRNISKESLIFPWCTSRNISLILSAMLWLLELLSATDQQAAWPIIVSFHLLCHGCCTVICYRSDTSPANISLISSAMPWLPCCFLLQIRNQPCQYQSYSNCYAMTAVLLSAADQQSALSILVSFYVLCHDC